MRPTVKCKGARLGRTICVWRRPVSQHISLKACVLACFCTGSDLWRAHCCPTDEFTGLHRGSMGSIHGQFPFCHHTTFNLRGSLMGSKSNPSFPPSTVVSGGVAGRFTQCKMFQSTTLRILRIIKRLWNSDGGWRPCNFGHLFLSHPPLLVTSECQLWSCQAENLLNSFEKETKSRRQRWKSHWTILEFDFLQLGSWSILCRQCKDFWWILGPRSGRQVKLAIATASLILLQPGKLVVVIIHGLFLKCIRNRTYATILLTHCGCVVLAICFSVQFRHVCQIWKPRTVPRAEKSEPEKVKDVETDNEGSIWEDNSVWDSKNVGIWDIPDLTAFLFEKQWTNQH